MPISGANANVPWAYNVTDNASQALREKFFLNLVKPNAHFHELTNNQIKFSTRFLGD